MKFFHLYDYLLYPSEDPDWVSALGEGLKCSYVKTREDIVNHGGIKDSIFQNIRKRQPVSKGLSQKSVRTLITMKESPCRIERFNCSKEEYKERKVVF